MKYLPTLKFTFLVLGLQLIISYYSSINAQLLIPQVTEVSLENGFSSMNWNFVFQDSKGFMWIGTNYGLNKYDGYKVTVFTEKKSNLQADLISNIAEDANGLIWIGYPVLYSLETGGAKYVDLLDPISNRVTPLEKKIKNLPFKVPDLTLLLNSKKQPKHIWLGTKQGQLYLYDGNHFKLVYQHHQALPITNVKEGTNQVSWIKISASSSARSFFAISHEGKCLDSILYTDFEHRKDNIILTVTDSNALIISTLEAENFIKPLGSPIRKFLVQNNTREPYAIHQEKNQIWIWEKDSITKKPNSYIKVYDSNEQFICRIKSPISLFNTPPSRKVIKVQDRQGGTWMATSKTNKGYILYFSPSPFQRKWCSKDSESTWVYSGRDMIELKDSTVFFAGIRYYYFKPKPFEQAVNHGLAFLQDKNDDIWVTREDNTVHKIIVKDKQYQIVETYKYTGYLSDKIQGAWAIHQDKQGRIWLGHNLGLSYFDTAHNEFRYYHKYNDFNSIKAGLVYHFHENDAGVWLATQNGLFLLDYNKGVIARYHKSGTDSSFLAHNVLTHIHEDKDGTFWITSKGGGLIHWNPKTKEQEQYTTEDGLSHNVLYAVYGDDYNNLWMSSDRGIMRFEKNSKSVNVYLDRDGISQEEFNTKSHLQKKDGTIYFGGVDGVTIFHPKDFQNTANTQHIPLQISNVLKRDEQTGKFQDITTSIINQQYLEIHPDEKSFIVNIALLDFKNSKANKYAYKIEGLDKDWTYLDHPEIRINNLPYGNHKLIAKGQGSSGIWEQQQLQIPIRVLRPFYLHSWFIALCIALIILITRLLFLRQTQQLKKRKLELEQEVLRRTKQIEKDKQTIQSQADDLKILDEVKSRFFANISHELRTPLTLILGPISYILNLKDFDEALTRKYLNTMHKNGKNLLQLIEEILDLSKLDADKLDLKEEATDLHLFLRRLFTAFDAQAEYLGIITRFDYQLDKKMQVLLDQHKVEKIVNNLISNSLKFTPRGKSITMKIDQEQQFICLQIIDQGKGIHPKDLPHIFERFYQSKQANQEAQGGTGIGLALSSELAALMHGKLTVKSQLDQGTIFSFSFPIKPIFVDQLPSSEIETDSEYTHTPIDLSSLPNNLHILIVEDNDDMRNFLVDVLTPFYNIASVGNGLKAMEYLTKNTNQVDLIISDLMMPEMDGFELLRQVKNDDLLRKIPLIMLTARAGQDDKLKALTIGVDSYLTKPFMTDELLAQVANTLYNYHQRSTWLLEPDDEIVKHSQEEREIPSKSTQAAQQETLNLSLEDQDWIKTIETYVLQNISNNHFNATQLSLQMNMTERTFRRKLKRITGMSPVKYIRELRLQMARQLLEIKKYNNIQQVCAATGFSTTHYFSKQFKARFGKTPSNYLN